MGGERTRVMLAVLFAAGNQFLLIDEPTNHLDTEARDIVKGYLASKKGNESLFLAVLRQLDLGREQFMKNMEDFSEGQKKKVLLAASLVTPAHLYIWDEPLNFIDVFSRIQIEKLILQYKPTMLLAEHDIRFQEKTGTEVIRVSEYQKLRHCSC